MSSFINTAKSPCICRPDRFDMPCKHISNSKNSEPCESCDLPRQYDDSISFGIKRYTEVGNQGCYTGRDASEKLDNMVDIGHYRSVGEMIDSLHSEGYSYQTIANMVGTSKKTVLDNKWRY